jgi:tetratricopeptide (TPR) repeat protein
MTKPKKKKHNHPSTPHIFVGREREITKIERALADPEINIISIYGSGGMGKTSLARVVLERVRDSNRFSGGIVWIDCTIDNSLPAILKTTVQTLEIDPGSSSFVELRDVIQKQLEAAPTLFVFDAYEMVADDDEVLSFIGRLPKPSKTIIISRKRIRLHGREIVVRLDSLSENEALEMLLQLLPPEQRKELDEDFFENVFHLTGGLPLFIGLVADLIRQGQSLPKEITELQHGAISENEVSERVLERVETTLPKKERQVLEALSVFAHPVEVNAIVAVLGINEWSDPVTKLTQMAFIEVVGIRYALHPIVRTFFRQRIPLDRRTTLERRMVEYFVSYVNSYLDDFDALEREWLNIQYAMERAYRSEDWQIIIEFVSLLGDFLELKGYSIEYTLWLERAIEASETVNDDQAYAAFLHNLAVQHQHRGEVERAIREYQQSLQMRMVSHDRKAVATTLGNLGNAYADLGKFGRAIDYYKQALMIAREVSDRAGEATTLNNMAGIYRATGQQGRALELLEQALPILRAIGERAGEATTLNNMAGIYRATGQPGQALVLLEQALSMHREVGNRSGEATTLNNMAAAYQAAGQPGQALELLEQALPILRIVGDRAGEATTLNIMAGVYRATGQPGQALELLEQALPMLQEVGDRTGEATTLINMAGVYRATGQPGQALELLEQALPMLQEVGDRTGEVTTLINMAGVYRTFGQVRQSVEHYERALRLVQEIGDRGTESTLLADMARDYISLGEPRRAVRLYDQAIQFYSRETSPLDWLNVTTGLSVAYAQINDWRNAKQLATEILQTLRSVVRNQKVIGGLTSWYEQMGEAAIQNRDFHFAARIFAEVAHRYEIQGREIPDFVTDRLNELKHQISEDLLAIIWAEVEGTLTPMLAQMLQDGDDLMKQERFNEAVAIFTKALGLLPDDRKASEIHRQRAVILSMRGICFRQLGKWEEAIKDHERSLQLFERLRDYGGEGRSLLEMGYLFELMNNYEDSRLHYMDAYRLYRRAGIVKGMATASEHLGRLEYRVRMLPQAVNDLQEARDLWAQLGERGRVTAIETEMEDVKAMLAHQVAKVEDRGEDR